MRQEVAPNPFWAAQEAFYVCQGVRNAGAWRELREWLTGPSVPRTVYYRKLAELSHRALRRPAMPDDRREAVAFAWGYFEAMVKAQVGGTSASSGSPLGE